MKIIAVASDGVIYENEEVNRQLSPGSSSVGSFYVPLSGETGVERAFWSFNRKVLAVSIVSAVIFVGFTVATFQVDRDFAFIAGPSGIVSLITGCMYIVHCN